MIQKLNQFAEKHLYPYKLYGYFQLISNPIFYLLWIYLDSHGKESFILRLGITLSSIPLVLINKWPKALKKYIPIYWYITVLYGFPFFFTYMLLLNQFNFNWVLNTMSALVWGVLILDIISLIIIIPIGIILAIVLYYLFYGQIYLASNFISIITTYAMVIFFCFLFALRREKIVEVQYQTMELLAKTIIHELRLPFFIILGKAKYLKENIFPEKDELLSRIVNIENAVNRANEFMDMIAKNVSKINPDNFKLLNIYTIVSDASSNFLYSNLEDNKKVNIVTPFTDFQFWGDDILLKHVLYNLIKNALYFIKKANKGEIYISSKVTKKFNYLEFKDTGSGIDSETIHLIFNRFYTTTDIGSGIGLSFCKLVVESFDGTIYCESEVNKYTKFIIKLPKVKNQQVEHEI